LKISFKITFENIFFRFESLATQRQSKQEKREGISQKFKLATLNRQNLIYFPHFCGWSHDLEIKFQEC
jgi:hypothetical protein